MAHYTMMIKRCFTVLTLMACCGALSYAQTDGRVGGGSPAHTQAVYSNDFSLTGSNCATAVAGSDVALDCAEFPLGVQEVFAFYNQSGNPFNSISINLTFNPANNGQYVGCTLDNIAPTWTTSNCMQGSGVEIIGGQATVTFSQGVNGEGIGCFNDGSVAGDTDTSGNTACLNNSVSAIYSDVHKGTQIPYINYNCYGGDCTPLPPPVQTSGPCTFPPGGEGINVNKILPWLVCGQDSWVLGIGINGSTFTCGEADPTCKTHLPVTAAMAFANTPEPPTLLLVGAAMIAMSLLFLKKKVHA